MINSDVFFEKIVRDLREPVRSNSTRCALPYGLRGGLIHYDERRVHYGKTDSMGGIFNSDEGKGQERKEAYLDGFL